MFADPRHSRIVLINPTRTERAGAPAELAERRCASFALLPDIVENFRMSALAVGDFDPSKMTNRAANSINLLNADVVTFWRDAEFGSMAAGEGNFVFLGGAWLEEEVLVASLEGVRLGYDVRLLTDLSSARIEADRALALDRLALHGVLPTTIRQAMLEWAVCLDDVSLRQKVQRLLA